jgi:uncharacterized protein (DUF952 family)
MTIILHMTPRPRWLAALDSGTLTADSLEREGFIHCSFPDQLERVANKHYRGLTDLVLLCIEADKLGAEVRYEGPINPHTGLPEPERELYGHVYGPINVDAVVKVFDFPPNADGSFSLPRGIPA